MAHIEDQVSSSFLSLKQSRGQVGRRCLRLGDQSHGPRDGCCEGGKVRPEVEGEKA